MRLHCMQKVISQVGASSDKSRKKSADVQRLMYEANFSLFEYLPTELRLRVWRAAFDSIDTAVALCSFTDGRCDITVSHPHSVDGQSPPVAQTCKEARNEWFCLARVYEGLNGPLEYLLVPRTLFFVSPSAVTDFKLEELLLPIVHVAVDIADTPDLFPLFEALARLPSLQTIIIVMPSDDIEEHQETDWQEEIRQDQVTLGRMRAIVDTPAPDGEWHQRSYMGWVLCNYLETSMARRYYAGDDRPSIKLFVDRRGTSSITEASTERPWALYLY